jgi:hypothetical protein
VPLTWEAVDLHAVNLVARSNLDLLKAVEDVELGEVERSVPIDHGRVTHDHEVEPTTTPSASGDGTVLGTNLLEGLADGAEVFGGERTAADTGRVRLDDTDDLLDGERRDTEAGDDTADRGRRGGHEGVRAVVDVEHERVGALDEDALARSQRVVHVRGAVDDERAKSVGKGLDEGSALCPRPNRTARDTIARERNQTQRFEALKTTLNEHVNVDSPGTSRSRPRCQTQSGRTA